MLAISDQPIEPSARVISSRTSSPVSISPPRPPASRGSKVQNSSASRSAPTTSGGSVPAASVASACDSKNGASAWARLSKSERSVSRVIWSGVAGAGRVIWFMSVSYGWGQW